eukprot:1146430-Prorocentrum_minimum.AAC.1
MLPASDWSVMRICPRFGRRRDHVPVDGRAARGARSEGGGGGHQAGAVPADAPQARGPARALHARVRARERDRM